MSDDPMRARIRALVQEYPGLHLRELARQLDTSIALVEYHVPFLLEDGSVERVSSDRHHRLYPAGGDLPHAALAALRDERKLHVILHLMAGPLTHTDLAAKAGMGKSTLSYHLRGLEDVGLVAKQEAGAYAVRRPERLRGLLDSHRPTPNLLERFARLWGDLYGP